MREVGQELMTPPEAAKWFRRSTSWLRRQRRLLKACESGRQPLYHVCVCRAYLYGLLNGLEGEELTLVQHEALAAACGLSSQIKKQGAGEMQNAKCKMQKVKAKAKTKAKTKAKVKA